MINLISIIKIDDKYKSFVQHEIYHRTIKFVFKRV